MVENQAESFKNSLQGGGECGRRIASRDWSVTALGRLDGWPQSLRTATSILLRSPIPIVMLWGEAGVMLYNDAYSVFAGGRHPELLGSAVREGWPEVADFNDNVMRVGLAGGTLAYRDQELTLHRHGRPEQVFMNLDYSPVLDESGRPAGVLAIVVETTERVAAGRRQAFRLALEERLRGLAEPTAMIEEATALLGQHLGIAQVGFAEVEIDQEHVVVTRDWNDGRLPSVVGRWRMDDFGPQFVREMKAGETIAIPDVRVDSRTRGADVAAAYASINVRAILDIALVKNGRMVAILFVHHPDVRVWTSDEVTLAEDICERLWSAVERARAERERERADAKRRESETRLRLAVDNAEIGFWDVDLIKDELIWPPRTKAMFGISPDVPVSMADFYAGLHPDDFEATSEAFAGAADPERRALYDVEYRTVGKEDGIVRWVAAKGRGQFDGPGPMARCTRVIGTAIDITARKWVEAELRELNGRLEQRVAERTVELRRFRDIVESTISPLCAFDTEYRLIAFNKTHNDEFRRVNGFDSKLGDVFPDLFIPEQRPVMRALMARALGGERFTVVEEFGRPEFGNPFWEITYTPLHDEEGRIVGAFHLALDISDRVRAQAELAAAQDALRQSQKMEAMGSLTGGVAHDFNNLLTPIIGSLDMLQRQGIGGEREQRMISGAMQSAERAKVLVQRLLAFARRQPLQPTAVDVGRLVDGMANLLGSTTGPQVRVVVKLAENLPPAKADPNQLEMALLNLGVNARDAMPEGGTLRISATHESVSQPRGDLRRGQYIRLSVADTGVGMDEATLSRAVEPFFSTKGIGKGTGLGLSMAHGLMAQLGGALTIQSCREVGTNVELWLPVSAATIEVTEAAAVPVLPRQERGLALLVDDEDVVRASTADMLEELGYRVREAESADAALSLVTQGLRPDILVTDHLMPGMTGVELAGAMRDRMPELQVLIVSGYAEAEGIAAGLPRLTKPFRSEELAASLAKLSTAI